MIASADMARWPIKLTANVRSHELFVNREHMRQLLQDCDGMTLEVTIAPPSRRPSDRQRGYYRRKIVPVFAEWMGEPSEDEVHDLIAFKFLRIEDCPITGAPRRKSTSPSAMSHEEFNDYLDRVMAWGTVDCHLTFPPPDPELKDRR